LDDLATILETQTTIMKELYERVKCLEELTAKLSQDVYALKQRVGDTSPSVVVRRIE